MEEDIGKGVITVSLVKRKLGGLGFVPSKRSSSPYLAISNLVKGSSAEESGLLHAGDVVIEVNGKSVDNMPYEKVLEVLDKVSTGEKVAVKVRAKDGYQAYVETTFSQEGTAKTVRVTRQNNPLVITETGSEINREVNGGSNESTTKATSPESEAREKAADGAKTSTVESATVRTPRENGQVNGSEVCNGPPPNPNQCPVANATAKPQQAKYVRIQNLTDGSYSRDTLHQTANIIPTNCTSGRCLGSLMIPYGGEAPPTRPYGVPREPGEVALHAQDFLRQYYGATKREDSPAHQQRLTEVMKEIEKTGTYILTEKELIYGSRLAWRNASRCIGRIQWNKLQMFDARDVSTPQEMFEAICKHIKYGTNKGNIRSAITVFPQRKTAHKDFRVWNTQLIRYACYKQPDGSYVGDPSNAEFTEICESLGWKGNGGRFDVLPLILQANGGEPELFEIPKDIILEVQFKHPKFPWFEELGLRWYALPAVSCLCLDVGGVEMPACPFNGWYMVTEIGARDLADSNRYNMLEPVAQRMGLDTKSYSSLWKDRAMVEINLAVLYSFQEAGVTLTDHHSAADSFMKHLENENKLRGGCPGDWVWIVPPISGSATPVFHQEMLNYTLKPSYDYQDDPWKHYQFSKDKSKDLTSKKVSFKEVAKAVKFSANLMRKALAKRQKTVILYATETGKSERYAKMLGELFSHAFDPKVVCMEEYTHYELENEQLVLMVTSTFGNGDPPENGEAFARYLYELRHPPDGSRSSRHKMKQLGSLLVQKEKEKGLDVMDDNQPLANLRYSVFGLGSRAYPNFCAFARSLDKIIRELGGEAMMKMGEGDELCGQEESFKGWAKAIFKAACDSFCVGEDVNTKEAGQSLETMPSGWAPGRYRLSKSSSQLGDLCSGLSHICGKSVRYTGVLSVTNLQSPESSRSTILAQLKSEESDQLKYKAGDHVAIFPANRAEMVQALIDRLTDVVDPDQPVDVEALREVPGLLGTTKKWQTFLRLPSPITLREALSRYLDITSVPSPHIINYLATMAEDPSEKEDLDVIGKGNNRYEEWKFGNECNILDVLQAFPSLRVTADLLLTQLPLLQPRFYSISSSPDLYPGEIHATVAVVQFKKQGGKGSLHQGVCSTWLNSLKPGDKVPCYVRQAQTFHMPEDGTVPIIMVGPGTGIAPFRSFWQQRQFDMANKCAPQPRTNDVTPESSPLVQRRQFPAAQINLDKDIFEDSGRAHRNMLTPTFGTWGDLMMFFGCRNCAQDNIYKDEMEKAKDKGALTGVWTALSRDANEPKRYVQDMLKLEAFDICDKLLSQGGHFYVCGDVSMAEDVCRTLQTVFQEYAAMSQQEAQESVDKMKRSGRYHEDIFGVTLNTREVTDRVRNAAKRAWGYIKTTRKMKPRSVGSPKVNPMLPSESRSNVTMQVGSDKAKQHFVA